MRLLGKLHCKDTYMLLRVSEAIEKSGDIIFLKYNEKHYGARISSSGWYKGIDALIAKRVIKKVKNKKCLYKVDKDFFLAVTWKEDDNDE